MTPRIDWTWAGGNFFAAASIRFWCWQRCACSSNPTRDNVTTDLWLWLDNHELKLRSDNSLVDEAGSSSGVSFHSAANTSSYSATSSSLEILPPQNGAGSPSGTCGADGKQFCPQVWNTTYFGSVPQTPPGATDIEKASGNKNLTVCGNKCSGPQDCSPGSSDHGCSCAFPFPEDAMKLGFDPVFPVAVCLVLAHVATSHVNPRDAPKYVNGRGEPYQCLCNATFMAPECCGSKNGVVYLD